MGRKDFLWKLPLHFLSGNILLPSTIASVMMYNFVRIMNTLYMYYDQEVSVSRLTLAAMTSGLASTVHESPRCHLDAL